MGDMIMAIYGAPVAVADHARAACETALDMVSSLTHLKRRYATWPAIDIGVGIHTGSMWVGNMGSDVRFAYTVTGDAVNLASRIEGLTRHYSNRVIISEQALLAAGDGLLSRRLDVLRVKGRAEAITIHELVGRSGEVAPETHRFVADYTRALALYQAGCWQEAVQALTTLQGQRPEDGPTAVLLERSRRFSEQPPLDWDGTWSMEEK